MQQEAQPEANPASTPDASCVVRTLGGMMKRPEAATGDEEGPCSRPTAMPEVLLSVAAGGESANMWRGFETREVLRLILQTLDEMGYR